MLLNIILLVVGIVLVIYGIWTKTKFFMVLGGILLALGLISLGMDYLMGTGEVNGSRLPFIIGG